MPLADGAGGASFISDARQISRSRVSPAEQVGEQIEGVGGWRPSLGSGGRCAGCTDGGAVGGKLVLQPTSSISSSSGISLGRSKLFLSILNHSIDARAPGLFLGALSALGQAAGLGSRGAVLGEFLPGLGSFSARAGAARALDAGRGQRRHKPQAEGPEQRGLEVGEDHGIPRKARTARWWSSHSARS